MKAGKYILIAIITLVAIGLFKNLSNSDLGSNAEQLKKDYSKSWISNHIKLTDISKCLIKNNISGCGELYVKEKLNDDSEFAIACTSDGNNIKYYLVWPNINKVTSIKDDGIERPL